MRKTSKLWPRATKVIFYQGAGSFDYLLRGLVKADEKVMLAGEAYWLFKDPPGADEGHARDGSPEFLLCRSGVLVLNPPRNFHHTLREILHARTVEEAGDDVAFPADMDPSDTAWPAEGGWGGEQKGADSE